MFDSIIDWLEQGPKEKLVGFSILFAAVYGLVWGFVEPFNITTYIKYLGLYNIGITIVISIIVLLVILQKRILRKIEFESGDKSSVDNWTTGQGNPYRNLKLNGFYGNVLSFEEEFNDASDLTFETATTFASTIQFVFNDENRFTIYLRVLVMSDNDSKTKDIWLCLKPSQLLKKPVIDWDSEMHVPVIIKHTKNNWLSTKVILKDAVRSSFGQLGWKYSQLLGVRIRGRGQLQSITVR